ALCGFLLVAMGACAPKGGVDSPGQGAPNTEEKEMNQLLSDQRSEAFTRKPADYGPFELKPEPELPCVQAEHVDVNLGNSPEVFVQAVYCQVTGKPTTDEKAYEWVQKLRTDRYTRRIDVVKHVCLEAKRTCKLVYSDPWKEQVELSGAPQKKVKRDVGAVFMFFFNCPGEVNCTMNWANTHVPGMVEK